MPLIGAQGPGSNISWRGNLDEYPDFFEFPQILEVTVGSAVTSITQTITGINYKALVTAVGSGASVSINGGEFFNGNDENNPIIIRNEDTVTLQVITQDTASRFDYNKTYPVDVTIGKRSSSWFVRTETLDDTPEPFVFTNSLNNEVSVAKTSNEVVVQGIDDNIGVDALVTSTTGKLFVNGVNSGKTARILNNDRLYLSNTTSGFYSTDVVTEIVLGSYETSWTIGTRVVDDTPDAFNLGSLTDVNVNTIQISNTITITGVDPNVNGNNPLEASITGANGEFKVVRDGVEIREYSPDPFTVQNGDQITVKAVASEEFETTIVASLKIGTTIGNFSIRTRVPVIKTFPGEFNFFDVTGAERTDHLIPPENRIDSLPITLRQMSTAPDDFGTASITGNGGDGSPAQFKVIRNGVTVRDFSSDNFQVRDDDQIILRIISSPNPLNQVQATFTVTGIDTTDDLAGVPGSTSDTWIVTSAPRVCTITTFSFDEEKEANPDQIYSRTFVAEGFDRDCGAVITTSDTTNSFIEIGNLTGTSLSVKPGDLVTVYLTCPYFDSTRSTTVNLTSDFGTQKSAVFKITPKAPPLPELTLDADPRNTPFIFPDGGSTTLNYTYDFVTDENVTTNFGVTTIPTPSGSGSTPVTNILETTTYSITVSNSTGSTTKDIQVTVGTPPIPVISLCTSDTNNCSSKTNVKFGDQVTLYWKSSFASTVTSPDFSTNNLQNGSITLTPSQDNKIYSITGTGPGGTTTATLQINLTPRVFLTSNPTKLINGQTATLFWSSDLATRVVTTNGFSAPSVSGFAVVNPTVTTTYSITVEDAEGFTDTATLRLEVEDDKTVDAFFFNPSSFTERKTGEVVTSTPFFSVGGNVVSGLSPNVSVTASVSGSGAQFASGGTSKTVQNGTTADSLTVALQNSPNQDEERRATLSIGTQSASFTSKTKLCIKENSEGSIDGLITVLLRRSPELNSSIAYGINGGNTNVSRTASSSGEQIFSTPGSFTFSPPTGVPSVKVEAVGGGGGGYSGRDCSGRIIGVGGGGGAATVGSVSFSNPNIRNTISGTVGSGGPGSSDSIALSGGFSAVSASSDDFAISSRRSSPISIRDLARFPPFNSPLNPLNLPKPFIPPFPIPVPTPPIPTPIPTPTPTPTPTASPTPSPIPIPTPVPPTPIPIPVPVPIPTPEYSGQMTQSDCNVTPGNSSVTISARNCGISLPTDCTSGNRDLRYYRVSWPPFSGATLSVTSNSQSPANTLGGGGGSGIRLQGIEPDGNGRARVWFCRTSGGGGTTFTANFNYRIRGSGGGAAPQPQPIAPAVPFQVKGGDGQATIVNNIIIAGGGTGGGWSGNNKQPGSGGSGTYPGGSAPFGGGGGGAGKISGGSWPSGTDSSLQGGTGELFLGNSGSGASGSITPSCTKFGGNGGAYGGGGAGGSGSNGTGGSGSSGAVRFSWEAPNAEVVTYNQLVSAILRKYWSSGSRGPTLSEIQNEVNKFKDDPFAYPTIDSLTSSINIQNIGPTPPNDNCGDPIPAFT